MVQILYWGVVKIIDPNNKDINNTNFNDNNHIILSGSTNIQEEDKSDSTVAYMELIKENIDYDCLMSSTKWTDREMYKELYQIICDVVCVPRKTIRIAGKDYPYNLVKSKFLKLTSSHLQYDMECMKNNTTKVANIKSYLITAFYNAPNTIRHYYTAEVNQDMHVTY